MCCGVMTGVVFFQAEDGIRDLVRSRGLGDVYKRQRVVVIIGKWFPTGAHKVGAAFGCLVPRLVTGQFLSLIHI